MINFKKSKEEIILLTNLNGVPIQNLTELGNEYLKMQDLIEKYKQTLEDIRESFNGFRISTIPFHIVDNKKMPHRMADEIQHYSERIIDKINEVLNK